MSAWRAACADPDASRGALDRWSAAPLPALTAEARGAAAAYLAPDEALAITRAIADVVR